MASEQKGAAKPVKALSLDPDTRALLLSLYRGHVGSAKSLATALGIQPRLPGVCPHCGGVIAGDH